jgi:hypothetical protein
LVAVYQGRSGVEEPALRSAVCGIIKEPEFAVRVLVGLRPVRIEQELKNRTSQEEGLAPAVG